MRSLPFLLQDALLDGLGCLNYVSPSITCVLCDKMEEHTADILIPHYTIVIPSKIYTHSDSLKNADFDRFLLIVAQP